MTVIWPPPSMRATTWRPTLERAGLNKEDAMAGKGSDTNRRKVDSSSEYVKGGKGRTDDVRGSGIYPASSPDAPSDAEVRTVHDFVKHRGPKPKGFKRAI
jgi:hypothetical protein